MSLTEVREAIARYDRYSAGTLDAFTELWSALADLANRSPESFLVPRVELERVASRSSLENARLFAGALNDLVGQIENVDDPKVVAAKAALLRNVYGLCNVLDDLERMAAEARRPRS